MTPSQLYRCDLDVRAMTDIWAVLREPPAPLEDLFLERNNPVAADCIRYALTLEPKPPFRSDLSGHTSWERMYPGRSAIATTGDGYWYWCSNLGGRHHCNELSAARYGGAGLIEHTSPLAALLWLLDHWVPEPVAVPV